MDRALGSSSGLPQQRRPPPPAKHARHLRPWADRGAGAAGAARQVCEAAEVACEDVLEHEQTGALPSLGRFNARYAKCAARFEAACIGPARSMQAGRPLCNPPHPGTCRNSFGRWLSTRGPAACLVCLRACMTRLLRAQARARRRVAGASRASPRSLRKPRIAAFCRRECPRTPGSQAAQHVPWPRPAPPRAWGRGCNFEAERAFRGRPQAERLARALRRERLRFTQSYNDRLFGGLVVAALAGIVLFRFVLRVAAAETAAWVAFAFLQARGAPARPGSRARWSRGLRARCWARAACRARATCSSAA